MSTVPNSCWRWWRSCDGRLRGIFDGAYLIYSKFRQHNVSYSHQYNELVLMSMGWSQINGNISTTFWYSRSLQYCQNFPLSTARVAGLPASRPSCLHRSLDGSRWGSRSRWHSSISGKRRDDTIAHLGFEQCTWNVNISDMLSYKFIFCTLLGPYCCWRKCICEFTAIIGRNTYSWQDKLYTTYTLYTYTCITLQKLNVNSIHIQVWNY